jgi:ABC-type glutathione transport system ATPase component
MIVVTHEMAFAREAADRVYFMDEGQFVEIGPPEQVISNPRDERTRTFLKRFLHGSGSERGLAVDAATVEPAAPHVAQGSIELDA